MKLAIQQPYFFPYIGYWQLIHAVDRFVMYDDVNYIKGGWVNRNRLLINGNPAYITIPLHEASSFKRICDLTLQQSFRWRDKLIKTIDVTYRRARCFADVFPIVQQILQFDTTNLADYLEHELRTMSEFIGIDTEFVRASRSYENSHLVGQDRVLDICRREQATTYLNARGGQKLYDPKTFLERGIELRLLVSRPIAYRQRSAEFVPSLSIIDLLMEVGPSEIIEHLDAFDLRENQRLT